MPALRPLRRHYADADVPPVRTRELWAWAGFDFANSGYTAVVLTAIFSAYFVGVVADGAEWATFAWTAALSVSYLLVMAMAPLLGLYADAHARKKALLAMTTLVCGVGTAALWFCGPGDVALALLLIIVTNTAFGTGENLIAAFLPELADEEGMGRLSGYGWALGYFGTVLLLGVCLWWVQGAAARGSDTPSAVRDTMLITGAMVVLAALPTFLLLRERIRPMPRALAALFEESKQRWRSVMQGVSDLPQLGRFLTCIVAYQAGVGTVITVAAIYAQQALGFTAAESILLILLVNITAGVGALVSANCRTASATVARLRFRCLAGCWRSACWSPPTRGRWCGWPRISPAFAWAPASRRGARWWATCARRSAKPRCSRCGDSR